MDIRVGAFELAELSAKNVILGKNGCGKSYLLKQVEQNLGNDAAYGVVRYISPERGGVLTYEPGIEQSISQNENWMRDSRRRNQSANFRQQSATLFRRLELLVLREMEEAAGKPGYVHSRFDSTIDKLNVLLERVRLERDQSKAFKIVDRDSGAEAKPEDLSSGESELISLGIETLVFVKEAKPNRENILLIDEPDVHLHPDLQDRLAEFMIEALKDQPVTLVLATHSTALLAGLAACPDTRVAFKKRGVSTLAFKPVTDVDRAILPIFGAHPLSNIFNQRPVLLVEGDDDERVWQQAVRSSQGRVSVFPCVVGSIDRMADYEAEVNAVIDAVYDNARGYSLRDRDLQPEHIDDLGHIVRMRLGCRAAENLMLSDDVLALAGTTWEALQAAIAPWPGANPSHRYQVEMQAFVDGGYNRRDHSLKEIRNILLGLISTKPWEVLVGQAIANLAQQGGEPKPGSLRDFLGEKVCVELLNPPAGLPTPAEGLGDNAELHPA